MSRCDEFISSFNNKLDRINSGNTVYSILALTNDLATAKITGIIDGITYNDLLQKIEREG